MFMIVIKREDEIQIRRLFMTRKTMDETVTEFISKGKGKIEAYDPEGNLIVVAEVD